MKDVGVSFMRHVLRRQREAPAPDVGFQSASVVLLQSLGQGLRERKHSLLVLGPEEEIKTRKYLSLRPIISSHGVNNPLRRASQ